MTTIHFLYDYNQRFGSKHFDTPYRSGLDKAILKAEFEKHGYATTFLPISKVFSLVPEVEGQIFLYTSSEDIDYQYKTFIEDIILLLETRGAKVIPFYKYLRANNNKVFMEGLRLALPDAKYKSIHSTFYGTLEEVQFELPNLTFPLVIKTAEGASGRGVFKADSATELVQIVKKIARTPHWFYEIKDALRHYKHKGYRKESRFRKKFILQNFISNLKNDWKVYYFGDKFYIFYRPIFKHRGFRASGGGYDNYFYGENANVPDGIFDFVKQLVEYLNVPQASLDIAFDGTNFHLIEMQFLYFGTAGILYSDGYFTDRNGKWEFVKEKMTVERAYTESIVNYLNKK